MLIFIFPFNDRIPEICRIKDCYRNLAVKINYVGLIILIPVCIKHLRYVAIKKGLFVCGVARKVMIFFANWLKWGKLIKMKNSKLYRKLEFIINPDKYICIFFSNLSVFFLSFCKKLSATVQNFRESIQTKAFILSCTYVITD